MAAPEFQIFWPLTTKSSPSRTARVRSDATSEPASGSHIPMLHADVPSRIGGEVGALLLGRAELEQRGAHLAVGEPGGGQRRALADQRLEHDEPLERAAAAAARLDGPGHAQPAPLAQLQRERAVGPAIQVSSVSVGLLGAPRAADVEGLVLEGQQLGGQLEVHRERTYCGVRERRYRRGRSCPACPRPRSCS